MMQQQRGPIRINFVNKRPQGQIYTTIRRGDGCKVGLRFRLLLVSGIASERRTSRGFLWMLMLAAACCLLLHETGAPLAESSPPHLRSKACACLGLGMILVGRIEWSEQGGCTSNPIGEGYSNFFCPSLRASHNQTFTSLWALCSRLSGKDSSEPAGSIDAKSGDALITTFSSYSARHVRAHLDLEPHGNIPSFKGQLGCQPASRDITLSGRSAPFTRRV